MMMAEFLELSLDKFAAHNYQIPSSWTLHTNLSKMCNQIKQQANKYLLLISGDQDSCSRLADLVFLNFPSVVRFQLKFEFVLL